MNAVSCNLSITTFATSTTHHTTLRYNHVFADGYNIIRVLMTNILERLAEEQPEVSKKLSEIKKGPGGGGMQVSKLLPALAKLVFMVDDPPSVS